MLFCGDVPHDKGLTDSAPRRGTKKSPQGLYPYHLLPCTNGTTMPMRQIALIGSKGKKIKKSQLSEAGAKCTEVLLSKVSFSYCMGFYLNSAL